uniref:Immunoglobulin V-set domain-containing protein n=1 Tax=Poecilia formosa TaxID=48698 RepID=A0A096MEA2_POEFO
SLDGAERLPCSSSQCVCSSLSLSVSSAATFVVNVTQSSYEAEENHSITLEWTFTTRTQGSYRKLFIYCEFRTSVKSGIIYVHRDGVEFLAFQDDQFSGRVQSDKDVLREGRIRLHVSRLRTEDSGLYLCDVKTGDGFNSGACRLNVTGEKKSTADQIQTQRPTLTPEPERGRSIISITVGLIAALLIMLTIALINKRHFTDVYSSDHFKPDVSAADQLQPPTETL